MGGVVRNGERQGGIRGYFEARLVEKIDLRGIGALDIMVVAELHSTAPPLISVCGGCPRFAAHSSSVS